MIIMTISINADGHNDHDGDDNNVICEYIWISGLYQPTILRGLVIYQLQESCHIEDKNAECTNILGISLNINDLHTMGIKYAFLLN